MVKKGASNGDQIKFVIVWCLRNEGRIAMAIFGTVDLKNVLKIKNETKNQDEQVLARYLFGRYLFQGTVIARDRKAAIAEWENALTYESSFKPGIEGTLAEFRDGNVDLAIGYYKEGIKQKNDVISLTHLGIRFMQGNGIEKNVSTGQALLQEATRQNWADAFFYLSHSNVYKYWDERRLYEECDMGLLLNAVKLNHICAIIEFSKILWRKNEYQKSISLLKSGLLQGEGDINILCYLCVSLFKINQIEEGLIYLDQAIARGCKLAATIGHIQLIEKDKELSERYEKMTEKINNQYPEQEPVRLMTLVKFFKLQNQNPEFIQETLLQLSERNYTDAREMLGYQLLDNNPKCEYGIELLESCLIDHSVSIWNILIRLGYYYLFFSTTQKERGLSMLKHASNQGVKQATEILVYYFDSRRKEDCGGKIVSNVK